MLGNQNLAQTTLTSMHKKSPRAFEFYLQYLQLKEEIVDLSRRLDMQRAFSNEEKVESRQRLQQAVEEMKIQLNLLNTYGTTTEELLFLSMNIDLAQFEPIMPGGKI